MPKVHRVGDTDSDADRASTGSPDVYANGGPTLGGSVAAALGLEDSVGIDDDTGRSILEGRAAELAAGGDPDLNEALEQFGGGSPGGINPVDGTEGAIPAPGSPAAGSGQSDEATNLPFEADQVYQGDLLIFGSNTNPAVLPEVIQKAEALARALGRSLNINSAYRTPEYNERIGGARNSMHVQRKALDIQWGVGSTDGRIAMLQAIVQAGFTGIGCYNDFVHVDIGPKRCWGPNGSRTGMQTQYRPILSQNGYSFQT